MLFEVDAVVEVVLSFLGSRNSTVLMVKACCCEVYFVVGFVELFVWVTSIDIFVAGGSNFSTSAAIAYSAELL